jgi:hypothetical protein
MQIRNTAYVNRKKEKSKKLSDLLTGQDFLDGQLHLLPVHGVGDLSDGQHQGGNVPINIKYKII